jgi:hypothetical protein
MMPTAVPSGGPTTTPSIEPSTSPTISSPPSLAPSHAPSDAPTSIPSVLPSSSPTLVTEVMADFSVHLSIESGELTENQINALKEATVGFLGNDMTLKDGKLSDIAVDFIGQIVIDVSNAKSNATNNATRTLFEGLSLQQKLVVDFSVSAQYSGPDNMFDLSAAVDPSFQDPNSRWYNWLSTADSVFAPLSPDPVPIKENASIESASNPGGNSGAAGGTIAVVSLIAIASLAVGIAASVYSIRQYRRSAYGQELVSPRDDGDGFHSFSHEENIEVQQQSHLDLVSKQEHPSLSKSISIDDNLTAQSWMKPPTTPNSLEMGKAIPIGEIMKKNPRSLDVKKNDAWNHIQLNKSESRIDPPTANSVVNITSKKKTDRAFEDPRQIGSLLDTNVRSPNKTYLTLVNR